MSAFVKIVAGCFIACSLCVTLAGASIDPQAVAARVDHLLSKEITPVGSQRRTGISDDQTFLRRASLDVIGELPTPEEVTAFALDPAADKRLRIVQRLLANELYGQNWATYWRDVILYRRSEDRALLVSRALTAFLAQQFNRNTSWDKIAQAMVTAGGDVRTDGRTGLIMAQAGRPEETVAEISRVFLGVQIQCAQCHDHPTDRWSREQFHQLAAFFPRTAVRPNLGGGQRTFLVVANDQPALARPNNNNRYRGTLEHYMPDLNDPSAKGLRMQPVFFATGEQLPVGTTDTERRSKLAKWITADTNPWFAVAQVNRMWSELVGEGFHEPVDDIGPDRTSHAPRTLEYLAHTFRESGCDNKWLMATIMASEAYQRKARSSRQTDEAPFLANCPQRLRADQLFNVLTTALSIKVPSAGAGDRPYQNLRGNPRLLFNAVFGYDPSLPRDDVAGSIPQALTMMNSTVIHRAISAQQSDGLGKLLHELPDDETRVEELYLRCLAREPTKQEKQTCLDYLQEIENRGEAFEDLLWALINSTEFLHRK